MKFPPNSWGQFAVSLRRVQRLTKDYRETGSVPELETLGQKPHATHPGDIFARVLTVNERCGGGVVAVVKVLRVRDDLSAATNAVHEILTEHDTVTENTNKQGR